MENSGVNVITKTDAELIQERIDSLRESISSNRQTGKTYRAINNIIDSFFNYPIGTNINLVEEGEPKDYETVSKFVQAFSDRVRRDFPNINFRINYPAPGVATVTRLTKTYQEIAQKRLAQWEEKLKEAK